MKKILGIVLPRLYGWYFNLLALFSRKKAAESAFTLFCTPRKGKILPVQKDYLKAAEADTVEIGGMALQTYHWQGERETVMLLHGWESNSFRWRKLIGFLREEGFNIIAFDAPAHGKSSGEILNVPLYAECTDHMVKKFRPQYMVAHSVGGTTAIFHQYQYNTNGIEKLVTIGSPSELREIMGHYQHMLRFNNTVLSALDDYFRQHFGFGINDFSTSRFASYLKPKGLLIHDELDQVAPVSSSERVHSNWKNSQLIKTRGLGHSMHQDEVNRQIVHFLNS